MLTAIRGDQIQGGQINNYNVAGNTDSRWDSGIVYEKLNLTNSLVATDLHSNESVHQAVLDSQLIALWDVATSQAVSGASIDVTTVVSSTATTDTAVLAGTEKGVLTTGTSGSGTGTENYQVQIRDASTKDPIQDGLGGQVYGELSNDDIGGGVGNYTLAFKKTDGTAFTMAVAEVTEITTVADYSVENVATGTASPTYYHSLNGKYFRISSPSIDYYVWYTVSGESSIDPAMSNPGRTGIAVTVAPLADANTVASATASAIGTNAAFSASSSMAVVTITNAVSGIPTVPQDGAGGMETGFGIEVVTAGSPVLIDFMFSEIYSYLTAPYTAFITGIGFADVVGISGSHNHHDLYYTKIELESGQLDNRYYNKTQMDGGQLDNRYYTESEIDPNPGTDTGTAKLDTRYFLESELISTSNGSSGADLVGVTPTGSMASATVQNALEELQGDIDNILDGTANINFSLDDAYDDGSVVAVDDTLVDWQLTDTKSFKITADTGATNLINVEALATGDVVEFDVARFTVNAADNSVFTNVGADTSIITTTSGNVILNAVDGVDIDAANVTIDGTAASSFKTTGAPLNIETVTSGDLTVKSVANLLVKDSFLGAALPLSQSGTTSLSANFDTATSIIGGINENADDLYYLINTTLPATLDGSAGADQVGATGITGVIPTGGTLGGDATVQAMLEGIALGSAGGKVFPSLGTGAGGTESGDPTNPGNLLDEKASGMYFKNNEIVYVLDTNRYVIVKTGTTALVEGTDWDYLWGSNEPMGGDEFNVTSDAVTVDTTGAMTVNVDGGLILADDSGAHVNISAVGQVDIDSAAGQTITVASDTEIELNGGTLVDIDGAAITMDGQLTATGAADDNMVVTTSGTGQIQLSAADEIDLTGGIIDINAGAGKEVFIDSDTEVQINGGALVDIDATNITTDGILTQTGATQVIGDMDLDGSIDHDGATFNSTLTDTGIDSFTIETVGGVIINSDEGIALTDDSGNQVKLNINGSLDLHSATGQTASMATTGGAAITTSDTEADITADVVDINATTITIDGQLTATGALNDNIIMNTTGTGQVQVNSEVEVDLNAPLVDIHGDVVIESNKQLYVDKINITSVDPSDYATITGTRGGDLNVANLLVNSGFEAGSAVVADNWTQDAEALRTGAEQFYNAYSLRYFNAAPAAAGTVAILTQTADAPLTDAASYVFSIYAKGVNAAPVQVSLGGGTAVELIATGAATGAWVRYEAVAVAGATNEDIVVQIVNAGTEESDIFFDAAMLETGSGAATDYFTTYFSNLVFTVGDEDNDQIIFRSEGTATSDLMRINQDTVEILGDLNVTGTTTTINSQDLLVADNQIVLNTNVTGSPTLDAFYTVERGDETNAQIKWNESTDTWELYNHSNTQFETIMTSATGSTTISMDIAYDGGSAVDVDDTDVTFTMDTTKSFILADAVDTAKFVVTAGSAADSVKIDTTGGVSFLASKMTFGNSLAANSVGFIGIDGTVLVRAGNTGGDVDIATSDGLKQLLITDEQIKLNIAGSSDADSIFINSTGGGIDVNATLKVDVDAAGIELDSTVASNFTVAEANLTLSTTTSGNVGISAATTVDIDAVTSVTVDAPAIDTTGVLTQTGNAQIVGDLDLDGSFDQSGNYTFLINTTATAADAVSITSAGGMDVVAASSFDLGATNINTTGILLQTGATQVVGDMDLDGSIDADGTDINIAAAGTGGTHLALSSADAASLTAVGITIEAGTGALVAEADAASSINVNGANLTVSTATSGDVVIDSAANVTFSDQYQTVPITFAQNLVDGLVTDFAYNSQTDFDFTTRETGTDAITSVLGAINVNREDMWEYIELLSTQGAAFGTAAGANLIGVDGITGILPTGGSVGDDSNLQAMLEGLALAGGGGKTYTDEATFLAAKAAGTFFKLNEHIHILDTNRTAIVKVQGLATAEGVDWDYVHGSARPMGDAEFFVSTTSKISLATADFDISTSTFDIVANNAVLVDGASTVTVDGATGLNLVTAAVMDMDAVTFDIDGTTFDALMAGGISLDASSASNFTVDGAALTLSTTTSGDVNITSAGDIVETSTTLTQNVTTFDMNASGAFTLDGAANSFIRTTAADLTLQTIGSGGIAFKDWDMAAAMPLTDPSNVAFTFDAQASAPVSIYDAINRAYSNTGDVSKKSYMEAPTLSSTDVSKAYLQVSDETFTFNGLAVAAAGTNDAYDLPGGGSNLALTPSQLRATYGVYLVVYLNGLRLSDSEWGYIYDQASGEKYVTFNNDHSTSDFTWATAANAVDAIALSVTDHIVFDCTYNRSATA